MNATDSARPLHTPGYFSLNGRCSRRRFVCIYFPGMFVLWLIKKVVMMMSFPPLAAIPTEVGMGANLLVFILSVLLLGPLVIRRMHDVGHTATFYLAGVSGRLLTLLLPMLHLHELHLDHALILITTICTVWGWLCTLIYFAICLLPSQTGSNDYGPALR